MASKGCVIKSKRRTDGVQTVRRTKQNLRSALRKIFANPHGSWSGTGIKTLLAAEGLEFNSPSAVTGELSAIVRELGLGARLDAIPVTGGVGWYLSLTGPKHSELK